MNANDNKGRTISESLLQLDKNIARWKELERKIAKMGMLTFEERLDIKQNIAHVKSLKKEFIEKYC